MTLSVDVTASFDDDGEFEVAASFDVARGDTLVVLGPSGSGKTLLLETVAGFHPNDGRIELDGRDLSGLPPERRDLGFVFQDYALFPHMTARENVRFGERYHGAVRDPDALLSELGVPGLADRYPGTLSGGERQRVALARALFVRPEVLLLDEPLSSLDVPTRRTLRDDLLSVLSDVTAVYVTHNRTTARILADRIAVMRDGEVIQIGDPEAVFERPATPFVATFTGSNRLPLGRDSPLRGVLSGPLRADATDLAIRPEHVVLDPAEPDLTASVERVAREDATYRVTLAFDGVRFDAFTGDPPESGAPVGVALPPERTTVFFESGAPAHGPSG